MLLFFLWLTGGQALWAQDNPVSAQVDRATVGLNETVTLSVIVRGANGQQPLLPTLAGFQVLSTNTASQFSMVNGVTSAQTSYQYVLQPTQTGALEVPAISVVVDGQTYQTTPLTVQVTQSVAPSQPSSGSQAAPSAGESANRDFFVESSIDQSTAYLGQQVTYSFRFYQAINLFDQPAYQAPTFTGFWHEQKAEQSQSMTDVAGRTYQVTTLQTILFPTVPGIQTITPATLSIPGSLFQRGTVLQTTPVTVTVLPLPTPAPADFTGAVGQIAMTATVSANTVAVNEPVTLRILLRGQGNITTWPDPTLPMLNGWRKFDSTAKTDTQVQDGRLLGTRLYEQLLVPTTAGPATLPGVTYVYFDPEQSIYQTIATPAFAITVTAGAAEAPVPTLAANTPAPVASAGSDIRHIKQAPTTLHMVTLPLTSRPLYWAIWIGPLLLLLLDGAWQWRRRKLANDPVLLRRAQAQQKARQALAQARKGANDPHAVVGQVLTDYLTAKLNQPIGGLTQTMLAERLRRQGLDSVLVTQVAHLLALSESGRFAPTAPDRDSAADLLAATETLITGLEKVL